MLARGKSEKKKSAKQMPVRRRPRPPASKACGISLGLG
jgi:hypothetical protein